MAEFKGSDFQIEIQKRMLARHGWIKDRPDIANGGRVLNFLEPSVTGWDEIATYLAQDGVVVLTGQPRATIEAEAGSVFGGGYEYPSWDIYAAPADVITAKCKTFLDTADLPSDWRIEVTDRPSNTVLEDIQTLNEETGVAPSPGFYLRSEAVPCLTACLRDDAGVLVATSSVNARYHPQSRFGGYVFNGSISVKPDRRGMSLGKIVNAHALLESQTAMGWHHAMSQVQSDNIASVKTVTACGFEFWSEVVTLAVVAKGEVFTR
jgi:hypothetical protein